MVKYGYVTTDGEIYQALLDNAKSNRRYMTPAESVLWSCLRNSALGVRFRRQHPIDMYIPDFVCLKKQLVIEVDGGYHFIDGRQISDAERTNYLNEKGYTVIRFTNDEVLNNIEKVIDDIKTVLNNINDER